MGIPSESPAPRAVQSTNPSSPEAPYLQPNMQCLFPIPSCSTGLCQQAATSSTRHPPYSVCETGRTQQPQLCPPRVTPQQGRGLKLTPSLLQAPSLCLQQQDKELVSLGEAFSSGWGQSRPVLGEAAKENRAQAGLFPGQHQQLHSQAAGRGQHSPGAGRMMMGSVR